ncbi:hypothetical protein IPA_05400 [Ignicoccus pacificus DSM 13166]|uniref:Uncharacterized protein n=1 Tax=Ignicoccus pacificus DSM 13166 TaxID=940294 RepID=A0A977PK54_9CREN|nr:hypothetical protein IPA_05400 [Ignicoccus pacificus DSM 13166]
MKEIFYNVTSGTLKIREVDTRPKLVYKECNNEITLNVIVPEEKAEDVLEAIKGSLPDDVLAALGVPATGEDLTEICEELKSQGYDCKVNIEEGEDYCETLEVDLQKGSVKEQRKLIKVVLEGQSIRSKPARSESKYLLYEREGDNWRAEAVIEYEDLEKIFNVEDRLTALVDLLLPGLGTSLEEPVKILEYLEKRFKSYAFQVTRDEDYYYLYIEI